MSGPLDALPRVREELRLELEDQGLDLLQSEHTREGWPAGAVPGPLEERSCAAAPPPERRRGLGVLCTWG